MKFKYIYIILIKIYLILNLNFKNIESAEFINGCDSTEYTCMKVLVNQLISNDFSSFNTLNGDYDFCGTEGFQCNNDGNIVSMKLNGLNTTTTFSNSGNITFICFTRLNVVNLQNFKISSNFFDTKVGFKELSFLNCSNLFPLPENIKNGINTLKIENNENSLLNNQMIEINLNSISSLVSFTLIDIYRNVSYKKDFKTDLATIPLKYFTSSITSIPDLTDIEFSIVYLYFDRILDLESFDNFKTFNKVVALIFHSFKGYSIPFPNSLSKMVNNSYLSTLMWEISFNALSKNDKKADFSNLLALDYIDVHYDNRVKSVLSEFPISKLPDRQLTSFSFKNAYFNDFPAIFSNVDSLKLINCKILNLYSKTSIYPKEMQLQENNIKGAIDRSYCGTIMDLSYNKDITSIPTCFTCYSQTYQNLYTGLPLIQPLLNRPCTTLIPNLSVLNITSSNPFIRLYGDDLGFNGLFIQSNPILQWEYVPVLSSTEFRAYINEDYILDLKKIDLSFTIPNLTFTVALYPTEPIINSIVESNGIYTIAGEFFTYNTTDLQVKMGNNLCIANSNSFYEIICKKQNNFTPTKTTNKLEVKVGGLKSTVLFSDLNGSINDNICMTPCGPGQFCNLYNGSCSAIINCNSDCSGHGNCDYSNGQCVCDANRIGDDCSSIQCSSDCGSPFGKGNCDPSIGKCVCNSKYIGDDCSLPDMYVSSVVPPYTTGGLVTLVGWFGSPNNNLSVLIGDTYCTEIIINSTMLQCNITGGSGIKSIKVSQNILTSWYNPTAFQYQEIIKSCPKNCDKNGNCNNGNCECKPGFIGIDCMSIDPSTSTTTGNSVSIPGSSSGIDNSTGSGTINNEQTNFHILLKSIVEIDINNNIIFEYPLEGKWKVHDSTQSKIIFSQNIIKNDSSSNSSIIKSILEEVNETKEYSFAGINFQVLGGSIKVSVEILNYSYSSSLNTLQLRMESQVSNKENDDNINTCNNDETKVSSDQLEVNGNNNNNYLNFLKIEKNAKVLYSRFLDRALSDGIPTFSTNTLISKTNDSVLVGINFPHCNLCIIDPDFSVLVSPDFKSSNSCIGNGKKKWILPVSIVASVVGASLIVIIAFIIIRKNRTNLKIGLVKLKLIKK